MLDSIGLDFEAGDILAAPADAVFQPIDEIVDTRGVADEPVSGMERAVAPGLGGGFRVVEITRIHRPRHMCSENEFSNLTRLDGLVVLIDNASLEEDGATGLVPDEEEERAVGAKRQLVRPETP